MSIERQNETRFFQRIVDEMSGCVIVTDQTGEIIYTSTLPAGVADTAPDDVTGQPLETVLADRGTPVSLTDLRQRAEDTESDSATVLLEQSGSLFSVTLSETADESQHVCILELREQSDGQGLERDAEFFEETFEAANDAILVFDPARDDILDCNARAQEMLGYARSELLSLGPSDIHPHELNALESFFETVMSDGKGWTTELSCYTKDDELIPAEISASRMTVNGRPTVLASIRDISDRRQYERRLEALNETTQELMTAESVAEIAEITVTVIQRVIDCPLSAVWEYDDETTHLQPVQTTDQISTFLDDNDMSESDLVIEPGTAEMRSFRRSEPRLLEEYDTVDEPAHPELPLQSRLLLPLGSYGLLAVGTTETNAITEPVRNLLNIVAGSAETALERLDSERKLRQRSAAVEAANDGIAILDDDEFVYINEAYANLFGYERREEVLEVGWRTLLDTESIEQMEAEVIPTLENEGAWRGELTGIRRDGTSIDLGVALTRLDSGGLINICYDISDRKAQERRLRGLNDLNQELMRAEDWDGMANLGLSTITECLPFDVVALRTFDSDANVLELDAMTDEAASLLESRPAYDLESTYAGAAYRRAEPVINETQAEQGEGEYQAYDSLHVPMQEYGTVTILTEDSALFDEDVVEFVRLVGTALGMGVRRVKREQKLRASHDELSRLNRINAVVRQIIQSLVEAATRNEIERTICEQLTDSDLYEYAWIGEVDPDGGDVAPRASAGIELDVLRATAVMELFETGAERILDAAQSGDIETVKQYQLSVQDGDANDDLSQHGMAADRRTQGEVIAVIPLSHGSQTYGVLIVSTTHSGTFDEDARAEFRLLGETAGFAISAAQNRQLLLSNRITELKFDVWDERLSVVAVSDKLDCTCRLETAEPTHGGGIRSYLRAHGLDKDAPEAIAEKIPSVEQVDVVGDTGDECLLEVVRSEPLAQELAQTGANIRTAVAESGDGEVVLEVPQSADIRKTVDKFQSFFPESKLVAKRKRERDGTSVEEFQASVENQLTDRQRTVLKNAYETGYFDWPRDSTAEEVAEEIGISSPTLHQHLRMAEQKLISTLLEE